MIIVKAPFRLPIAGGGCDLPSYYEQFGAELITSSINKFMYVFINEPPIPDKIRLHYSQIENVDDVGEIKHGIIREALKLHGINRPIEITSMADMASGTGMGSSSAFTVALLAGLNALQGNRITPWELAEEACKVEIELVNNPIGKQDQYASVFGGINELKIDKMGYVAVCPLKLDTEIISELENRLLMFYTGITHDANEILAEQGTKIKHDPTEMDEIRMIGGNIKKVLIDGNLDELGYLLDYHWRTKKKISGKMSDATIDGYYELALGNGASGGKLMGAGGGGLLLLCTKEGQRKRLKSTMINSGLKHIDFRFEFEGVKVMTI
jgi:D-glycero-alpha-D-manno-heptose-7-phosphate kinase